MVLFQYKMTQFDLLDDNKDSSDAKESSDEQDDNVQFPQSYIIIKFGKNVKTLTLNWLVDKIRGQRRDGGAELIVRQQPYEPNEVIGVMKDRLLLWVWNIN